ncbi:hypothetical protein [Nostoc sp.]
MPLGQTILGQLVIAAVVAELIEEARAYFGCFGVAVNVAQRAK